MSASLPMTHACYLFVVPRSNWWRDFIATVDASTYEGLRNFLQEKYGVAMVEHSDVLILCFPDADTKVQFQLSWASE